MKPVIVVTGASKGIGLEVTRILLEKFNANVIAISRTRTPELIQLGSDSLLIVECDVTDENALSNAISLGASRYHGIDGLILNAGTLDPLCRIGDDTPLDSWKHHFDVNFFSLVTAIKAALPTLAEEEPDVACVAVRPGMVDTGMQSTLRAFGGSHMNDKDHKAFIQVYDEGRLVKPQDCGHVIAALSLQAPKTLSGQFVSWDSEEYLRKEQHNLGLGWKTPAENLPWSPEISLRAMDAMQVDIAILTFPALSSGSVCEENRTTARRRNELASAICREHPERFGFFATLPFLDDVKGCLEEIQYALDILNASGVSLSSCYGEGQGATYIGDKRYDTVWEELNRRQAVVFVHGSQIPGSTPYPHSSLGIPITEVPNETFKAAAHLVVTGNRRKFPDVKVILAHLGGSVPVLAARVAVLSNHMGCILTPEEILEDFKTFYYETALSGYEANLAAIEKFVAHDHILFGTDFPGND
ncbi:hypothetical protein CVT25_009881 [Psilocybe cyanescens]|uniref:Amidohydrolase-related domain-containing protein n=1 Tax=Psilocybe cyanescens TaxID=93625 RepID=A0A409XT90_PSICY|nr:hypothetical protein CVT25_009881 [Psilocybe cyanescens]